MIRNSDKKEDFDSIRKSHKKEDFDSYSIDVRNDNVEGALRILKKRIQKDGLFFELKKREFYAKPSEKRRMKKAAAIIRQKKIQSKKGISKGNKR
jgi:small subunit ribosomal protein S21